MEKIDLNKLKKFQRIVDSLDRSVSKISKRSRCEKQIFVNRYFNFITNKCYKIKIKGVVYYAIFHRSKIKDSTGDSYYTNGID